MSLPNALMSGSAGAATVTVLHQAAKERFFSAPRVDIVGMRALKRLWHGLGLRSPGRKKLYRQALAGEVLSNGAYYALASVGSPRRPLARGAWLGAAAGLGAVFLPPRLGLGRRPVQRSGLTALQTFTWYFLGGVAAGGTQRVMQRMT